MNRRWFATLILLVSLALVTLSITSRKPAQAQNGLELTVSPLRVVTGSEPVPVNHDPENITVQDVLTPMDFPADVFGKVRTFTNTGTSDINWISIIADDPWVIVSPTSLTIPPGESQELTVYVDRFDKNVGSYQSTIRLVRAGGIEDQIPVTMEVASESIGDIDFGEVSAPSSFTLALNLPLLPFEASWQINSSPTWLKNITPSAGTLDPGSGFAIIPIQVTIDPTSLAEGFYSDTIFLTTSHGPKEASVSFTYTPDVPTTYSISGQVLDTNDNPVEGVTISDGAGHTVKTDANGNYTLDQLPAGVYTLSASKEGYEFSPPSQTLSVPPNASGVNFVGTFQAYTIAGQVLDTNNNPIPGVIISAGGGHTATTDANGNYLLEDLPGGTYTIIPSTSSQNDYTFSPGSRPVTVPPDGTEQDFTGKPLPGETDPTPTPESGKPLVKEMRSCFTGAFFIKGSWLPNRYDAFVDWQGSAPKYVKFILNDTVSQEDASIDPVSHVYNMGADLKYGLLGQYNTLETRPVAQDVIGSPYRLHPIGVGLPVWFPPLNVLNPDCVQREVKFKGGLNYPDPPFCEDCRVTLPGIVPLLGDKSFGIPPTSAGLQVEFTSGGNGAVEVSGTTGFEVADQKIEGTISGKGEGTIQAEKGIILEKASFGLGLAGEVTAEEKLVNVICKAVTGGTCPLREAEQWLVVGKPIRWFNDRAIAQAKAEPGLDLAFNFRSKDDQSGWEWENGEGTGRVRVTLALIVKAIENLSATLEGGGEPSITLQVPAAPSYLKKIAIEIFGRLKLKAWRVELSPIEISSEWFYAPGDTTSSLGTAKSPDINILDNPGWHPIPRTYAVNSTTYAIFQANKQPLQLGNNLATLNSNLSALSTQENIIATNVFPESHPTIAINGSTLLLWVHDDTSKPLMQGEEIYYSTYNGTTWSTPAGITNDNLQDFTPQIAFDGTGNAVAVWERNKVLQSGTSEFNADYTNAFELAYAVWDGNTWGTPTFLTDNNALDHAPILAQGNDGTLLLIWRQNPTGELLGTAATPDTIFYALWNGTTWGTPQILLNSVGGVLGLTAARYDANTMAVVYSQDVDGDLGSSEDQELHLLTWNGSAWSSPTALTNDNQPDNRPTFLYDGSGNPRLLWLKDDTLYALPGNLTGTPQAVAVEASAAILDYQATQDNDGNLVLLWQGYSEEGVDVFYATFDQAHNVFSLVEQLTHDEPLEKFMAPTFMPTGEMLMAYNKTALMKETITVSPTLTIENVTTFGQTDLYVLSHTFGPDLALNATDLNVNPPNPALGSIAQLSATFQNLGDHAVVNPEITFYLGDPDAGGTPLGTAIADLTLAGGMTTTLSIDWVLPTSGGPFPIYAVADPNNAVTELNEANNKANFFVAVPDLTPDWLRVGYGSGQVVTLTATLSNTGVTDAPVTVAFRLDDPITGTVVATGNAANLAAGAETEVQAIWNAASTPTDRYKIYAVADPDDVVVEADETNNDEWTGVGILPDLALRSTGVLTGFNGGDLLATVWVFNEGLRDANSVTLGLYNQIPVSGTEPLVATTLDIPAGEHRVVTLNLGSYALQGFYAGVGINGEIEDRDISNNLLLVGQKPGGLIYLPTIFKNFSAPLPPTPDLIIDRITATANNVEVVIKNVGEIPVTDAFWVDAYINPHTIPTGVNQIWPDFANQGLVWGVDTTIPPNGATIILRLNDAHFYPQWSTFSTLPEGTPVYVQVDSVNFDTTYGNVLETHELAGGAYNNISSALSTLSTAEAEPLAPSDQPPAGEGLPPRE